jgi:hypothetical protein
VGDFLPVPGDSINSYGLLNYQLNYAGMNLPEKLAQIKFTELAINIDGPSEESLYSNYLQHTIAIGGGDLPGESYEEWLRRGPLFSHAVVKPMVDTSTELTCSYAFDDTRWAVTSAANGVQPILFVTSQAAVEFSVAGGVVVNVLRHE